MLPHAARASRLAVLLATALSALAVAAPAAAQGDPAAASNACDPATLKATIIARNADLSESFESPFAGFEPLTVICRDFSGDGAADALWKIDGGGSGGAFYAGITTSGLAGAPPTIVAWVGDRSHLQVGVHKQQAVIAWPKYHPGDANCCPSMGMRWRLYSAGPNATVKASKVRKTKKRGLPFKLRQA